MWYLPNCTKCTGIGYVPHHKKYCPGCIWVIIRRYCPRILLSALPGIKPTYDI